MRNSPFWWILLGFMILLDFYFFQSLKVVSQSASHRTKIIIYTIYWTISAGAILLLILLPYLHFEKQARFTKSTIFAILAGLFFAKLVASFFFIIDDLRRLIQWIAGKLFFNKDKGEVAAAGEYISRSVFLSWAGMLFGGGLFGTLIYGFRNKYNYQVKRIPLVYDHLPAGFKGIKIVQISDIHSGSLNNKAAVMKGVQKILDEKPDLILFTGDLVNNLADEMDDYMDVFSRLKAPMGVYSTLGNHDYGDYTQFPTAAEKTANHERLKAIHAELGWRLLINEHVVLERGGDKIALIGIENWSSKARFPKYGDMPRAYAGSENLPFKILMSHDPSHWQAEVVTKYQDVDLMLSGHTHGMQFGVEIPGFKWSPVQYVYKEWAGLYEQEKAEGGTRSQKLYVNRGFGFLGYPGRVGILPEITVLELS
ncbi:MAG: metallophosphoesterase [Chitinophagaceae bacterium]|nr:metallophosphoesterase [Chitinophagaceae bacterium]